MNNGKPFEIAVRVQSDTPGIVIILDYDIKTDTLTQLAFTDAESFERAATERALKQVAAVSRRVFSAEKPKLWHEAVT